MIDSVIGNASGYPINTKFLDAMHDMWFVKNNISFGKTKQKP